MIEANRPICLHLRTFAATITPVDVSPNISHCWRSLTRHLQLKIYTPARIRARHAGGRGYQGHALCRNCAWKLISPFILSARPTIHSRLLRASSFNATPTTFHRGTYTRVSTLPTISFATVCPPNWKEHTAPRHVLQNLCTETEQPCLREYKIEN